MSTLMCVCEHVLQANWLQVWSLNSWTFLSLNQVKLCLKRNQAV